MYKNYKNDDYKNQYMKEVEIVNPGAYSDELDRCQKIIVLPKR